MNLLLYSNHLSYNQSLATAATVVKLYRQARALFNLLNFY